jgi:hypothetical protein
LVKSIEFHRDNDGLDEEVAGEGEGLACSTDGVVGKLEVDVGVGT